MLLKSGTDPRPSCFARAGDTMKPEPCSFTPGSTDFRSPVAASRVEVDADGEIRNYEAAHGWAELVAALRRFSAGVDDAKKLPLLLAGRADGHRDADGGHVAAQVPRVIGDGEEQAPADASVARWAATTRRLKVWRSELVVMRPKRRCLAGAHEVAQRAFHQNITKSALCGIVGIGAPQAPRRSRRRGARGRPWRR